MQTLRDLRESRGLTQAQLAIRAGVDHATIFRIETSRVTPQTATLERILRALDVRPEEVSA